MNIILNLIITFMSFTANAENIYYSNFVSHKYCINNVWSDWSDWKECYITIKFDHTNNTITVNNKVYNIIDKNNYKDETSNTIMYLTHDFERKRINIRLRYQNDGVKQLYVDKENTIYVYNLIS